ncbi:MAG: N-acetylmuramoyl-L-alanine amidase [Treponema sp.]|jgi:N-acetylmuramoyl-L-alanine amidase|nr:N-acetylmuramoyl-L-alanine amidase [Treponema sp.]
MKKYICLFLVLFPRLLYAQAAAPGSRVFTLDETVNILYAADDRGQKEFHWDPFFQEGSFTIGGHYGAFSTALSAGKSGFLMIDNREIYPVPLPYMDSGALVFTEPFINTAKEAFARSIKEDLSHYRIAAIIIDPGHGGTDTGAASTHTINGKKLPVVEKDIVLKSSKLLRDMLTRAYPDKRILMTRESDITCSLEERPAIANAVPIRKNEAIIYISIHANSHRDKNARGFEVWYLKQDHRRNLLNESDFPDSPELRKIMNLLTEEAFIAESIRIAESILTSLKTAMGRTMPSRGLKEEEWFVVRRSRMPAVLVELGFVSNKDDALLMTADGDLHKLVEAVYKGIIEFVGDFERSGGFIAAQ